MKNRIRYTLICISLIAATLFYSCDKWLEEDTRGIDITGEFYKNFDALQGGLVGIYAGIPQIFNNNSVGVAAVGTDVTYTTRLTSNIGPLDQYNFNPSTDVIYNWYSRHFDVVQRANIVISRGPATPEVTEAELNRILGEARFLRAWAYFRLVQTFGKLPVVLEETQEFNFRAKRDPIEQVYRAIIEDLQFAAGDNTLPRTKNGGHATHWAAKALLAKVYLTIATSMERDPQPIPEYGTMSFVPAELLADCMALCDDIIANGGFRLLEKYGDVFIIANKNNNAESIWEIQFSTEPNYGSQWSKQYGVFGNGTNNIQTINAMVGTTAYQPVPSFYRYYKLGDARRKWNISDWHVNYNGTFISQVQLNGASLGDGGSIDLNTDDPFLLRASLEDQLTATRLGTAKYRWGKGPDPDLWWQEGMDYDQANSPNNVIVLRYADVLLMRAEADVRINGTASATTLSLVNGQIVARARGIDPSTGRWYTEADMLAIVMQPYEGAVANAQENVDNNPGVTEHEEALAAAELARDLAAARTLKDYTAATLTADELLTERARELCFEFQRWFDLVRTGKLKELVEARTTSPTASPRVTVHFDRHFLFPIPQKEIDMATDKVNFAQNPRY